MDWHHLLSGICETAIYSLVGIALMGIGFFIVKLFTPFSIKKEIEEEQNMSLGIIIGAIIIGISLIVSAVISSPSGDRSQIFKNAEKQEIKVNNQAPAK